MKNSQKIRISEILALLIESLGKSKPVNIEIFFRSGKNKYKGYVLPYGEELYEFTTFGNKFILPLEDIPEAVAHESVKYDEAEITIPGILTKKIILASDKNIIVSEKEIDKDSRSKINQGLSDKRDYYIELHEAKELFFNIGITDNEGKIKNEMARKYNQIDRFISVADSFIQKEMKKKKKIVILDAACGKSYLSFALYFYISKKLNFPCEVTGLDIRDDVISASKNLAKKLGYNSMNFIRTDLADYVHKTDNPSLCISLHACDTATDYALFTAIKTRSYAFIAVPCCHKELYRSNMQMDLLEKNMFKFSLLKEKFSALMTETIRLLILESAGYKVLVSEYISPLDSPKNILIAGTREMNINNMKKAQKEYRKLFDLYKCKITLGDLTEREEFSDEIYCGHQKQG